MLLSGQQLPLAVSWSFWNYLSSEMQAVPINGKIRQKNKQTNKAKNKKQNKNKNKQKNNAISNKKQNNIMSYLYILWNVDPSKDIFLSFAQDWRNSFRNFLIRLFLFNIIYDSLLYLGFSWCCVCATSRFDCPHCRYHRYSWSWIRGIGCHLCIIGKYALYISIVIKQVMMKHRSTTDQGYKREKFECWVENYRNAVFLP